MIAAITLSSTGVAPVGLTKVNPSGEAFFARNSAQEALVAEPSPPPAAPPAETRSAVETAARFAPVNLGGKSAIDAQVIASNAPSRAPAAPLPRAQQSTSTPQPQQSIPSPQGRALAKNFSEATRISPEEAVVIARLQARDREVRAHENAHAAAGGSFAGRPQLEFQTGPDGRQYAVAGSVSIDVSPVNGDPAATLRKAETVKRAALAPAQPSSQDRSVASAADALAREARAQLAEIKREEAAELRGETPKGEEGLASINNSENPAPITTTPSFVSQAPEQPVSINLTNLIA